MSTTQHVGKKKTLFVHYWMICGFFAIEALEKIKIIHDYLHADLGAFLFSFAV